MRSGTEVLPILVATKLYVDIGAERHDLGAVVPRVFDGASNQLQGYASAFERARDTGMVDRYRATWLAAVGQFCNMALAEIYPVAPACGRSVMDNLKI